MPTKNILIILGSKADKQDIRSGVIVSLCKAFGEKAKQNGCNVDFLDLYKEKVDEDITLSKKKELQTRIEKADLVAFFFNSEFQTTPSSILYFVEEVLEDGFAYKTHKKLIRPILKKQSLVVCTSTFLAMDLFVTGSLITNFWQKIVFRFCGFKGKVIVLDDLRGRSDKEMVNWKVKVEKLAEGLGV